MAFCLGFNFVRTRIRTPLTEQIHLVHFYELNEDFFNLLSGRVLGTDFEVFKIEPFHLLLCPPFIHFPLVPEIKFIGNNNSRHLSLITLKVTFL